MADDPLLQLASEIQRRALAGRWTVATAESCTGGLVAHLLTEIPGSSGYVTGGFVAYSNDVKRDELGVPAPVLEAHGAVSAQVARAMADGARERLGTTLAVSVTGVAGPDGGSDAKPVGLTYVAVAGLGATDVRRHQWTGDRHANKLASAEAALALLLERLADAGRTGDPAAGTGDPAAGTGDPAAGTGDPPTGPGWQRGEEP